MRIIAGQFRSRVILPPEDDRTTRPITDRVKQSLFDILTPLLDGAIVYDVFAGTGSMGLESLSRGAAHATFFEADRSALQRLKKNIASLGVDDSTTIIRGDLFKHFRNAPQPPRPVTVAFLDPPYRFVTEQPEQLQDLAARVATHLSPDGLLVFRHDARDTLDLAASYDVAEARVYGNMTLELLKPRSIPLPR
jgi:16S rRNA (guanine966-N2)-methyltransferase